MPIEYQDLIIMRETNMRPWDLRDPRFTLEDRNNILACLSGESKADKVRSAG